MADTHQEWLKKMEEQSRAKQVSFMDGIARKLGRQRLAKAPA